MSPNKYNAIPKNISTHSPINNSYFKNPHRIVISANDKNFKAKASSKKPKTTFTEFIHEPDFGKVFSHAGKAANNPNGNAKAVLKPNMTKKGPKYSPFVLA